MINENNTNNTDNTNTDNNPEKTISYYNKQAIKSFFLCFIPSLILLAGYVHSGGSFDEGSGGAIWWLYFPLLMFASPIVILDSIYTGIVGLKGNRKFFSIVSLLVNISEIILIIMVGLNNK